MLFRCQPGFENSLAQELAREGFALAGQGEGWARVNETTAEADRLDRLCFPHLVWLEEQEVAGDSVNALAEQIGNYFLASARDERFDGAWPVVTEAAGGQEGLGRRADAVMRAWSEGVKRRMSRVARLATTERLGGCGERRGLFVFFVDFQHAIVARRGFFGGQRRMADDPLAPSRSYLKIEEAYGVLGREPAPGETVVDLGAAPGGWSYSAAKRGARVVAVDNGPLKGGALNHPQIEHRREDAFRFRPQPGETFDWLFCDLVEEPHHVMRDLVGPWLQGGWCRQFVVMLKFGRVNAIELLRELRAPQNVLQAHARAVRIRHLFHDREELTIVGEVPV